MAYPGNLQVVVTAAMVGSDGTLHHSDGNCYAVGATVEMTPVEYARCQEVVLPEPSKATSKWPLFCTVQGAYPQQNSNFYVIEPGASVCIDLTKLDEECPPNRVYLNACGGCYMTQIDTPVVLETTENLNGPTINPNFLWVGEDPITCETPSKLYVANPNETPIYLSAAFYS